jgi:hypothetical protein
MRATVRRQLFRKSICTLLLVCECARARARVSAVGWLQSVYMCGWLQFQVLQWGGV